MRFSIGSWSRLCPACTLFLYNSEARVDAAFVNRLVSCRVVAESYSLEIFFIFIFCVGSRCFWLLTCRRTCAPGLLLFLGHLYGLTVHNLRVRGQFVRELLVLFLWFVHCRFFASSAPLISSCFHRFVLCSPFPSVFFSGSPPVLPLISNAFSKPVYHISRHLSFSFLCFLFSSQCGILHCGASFSDRDYISACWCA